MRTAVSALVLLAATTAAHASPATLAKAQTPSIRKTARFVTLERWDGRVDEMLGSYGRAHAAPATWRAGDPHWGGHTPPPDSPLHQTVREQSVRSLMDARASAVRFLSTGLDGQLQLLVYDRQDALGQDIDSAVAACAKAKHQ